MDVESDGDRRGVYDERLRLYTLRERELDRRDRRMSFLRLGAFLLSLASLAITFWFDQNNDAVWYAASVTAFLFFLVLIWRHTVLAKEQRSVRAHVRLNTEALHRLARTWDALPLVDAPSKYADLPVTRDLMLFGRGSLAQ